MRKEDIFDIVEPVFKLHKFLGFISYTFEKRNDKRCLKQWRTHFFLTGILQIISFLLNMILFSILKRRIDSIMEYYVHQLSEMLEIMFIFNSCISSKIYNNNILRLLNNLRNIENKISTMKIILKHKQTKYFV